MATLTQMNEQLAELTAKVEAARAQVHGQAVTQFTQLMADYGVTVADLLHAGMPLSMPLSEMVESPKSKGAKPKSKGAAAPKPKTNGEAAPKPSKGTKPAKYQDPESGLTWSGMGHEPFWIKGKKRDKFLIPVADASTA
jgi:DNA-binding protein H-NS